MASLGVRGDRVVELHQLVERPVQPGGVPLGPGGQRPVVDVPLELGEALRQLAFAS